MDNDYVIEMLGITKDFPGVRACDNITLKLKRGEIHALLGENGAGKSTLMSILFGLYSADAGQIKKNGEAISIRNPNDANDFGIGMVHQHFKLVEVFSCLENIILGIEPHSHGFLRQSEARQKVIELSDRYGLHIDPDALIEDISVGMQQRTEILKMLYRDNEILIFDEPTAVLTPREISELMRIMRDLADEGKSILFITHKLAEIMAAADRCTVIRKGKLMGTLDVANTTREELSRLMVGRNVSFAVEKGDIEPGEDVLSVEGLTVPSKLHKNNAVKDVSFKVRGGEIVCIAGIDGNGQTELAHTLAGLEKPSEGVITLCGRDITKATIRERSAWGMSHIPEDRHKHGLILDFTLAENIVLQRYWEPEFRKTLARTPAPAAPAKDRSAENAHSRLDLSLVNTSAVQGYAERLIEQFDIRSGQGAKTITRSMSGGNQQKAIVARELDRNPELLIAVQPTRGLDVGAIEYIHGQLVKHRDAGGAVLLISLELDEVMNLPDRILVMYEGEVTGEFLPEATTTEELGLYMSGAKRQGRSEVEA